jgi:parallel beta-helix repeat protein
VAKNPTELHVVNEAIGLVTLPELSEGSHRLTVYVLCGIYDYHGANPLGAPFKPTSPGSTDYVASWDHTLYFTIDTQLQEDTIYIRADGSVEGTDKIQRNGDVYTFIGNINGGVLVEKESIVIDGAGYTLQGNGNGSGVNLRGDVTVQNLQIINFSSGLSTVSNNTILGNYIADCFTGINILGGSNNTIRNNTIANNVNGISICYSGGDNVITGNNMINDVVSSNNVIIVWIAPEPTVDRNYWSDYTGIDRNGDGIGDSPYMYIDTDYAKYVDNHPLMEPVPVIPEFPIWTPVLSMLLFVMVFGVIYKQKLCRPKR